MEAIDQTGSGHISLGSAPRAAPGRQDHPRSRSCQRGAPIRVSRPGRPGRCLQTDQHPQLPRHVSRPPGDPGRGAAHARSLPRPPRPDRRAPSRRTGERTLPAAGLGVRGAAPPVRGVAGGGAWPTTNSPDSMRWRPATTSTACGCAADSRTALRRPATANSLRWRTKLHTHPSGTGSPPIRAQGPGRDPAQVLDDVVASPGRNPQRRRTGTQPGCFRAYRESVRRHAGRHDAGARRLQPYFGQRRQAAGQSAEAVREGTAAWSMLCSTSERSTTCWGIPSSAPAGRASSSRT